MRSSTILVEAWYVGKVRYGAALYFDDQSDTQPTHNPAGNTMGQCCN